LSIDRTASLPFFRFDERDERRHRVGVGAKWSATDEVEITGDVSGRWREGDNVRTLLLAPTFADTKNRQLSTRHLSGSVQALYGMPDATVLPGRIVVGADVTVGRLSSDYYSVWIGDLDGYEAAPNEPAGEHVVGGDGDRSSYAGYAQVELFPVRTVRATLGARIDHIEDSYDPSGSADGSTSAQHTALSPKAGVNIRYVSDAHNDGNVYLVVSRSFKTATLDQLFDQRPLPIPFDPFQITISNAELKPQSGVGIEVGVYHQVDLLPRRLRGNFSASAYRVRMKDELDFDLDTFRFVNLGESEHLGVEISAQVYHRSGVSGFVNYAYQGTTLEQGDFKGNYVKAVPRDVATGGVRYAGGAVGGSLTATAVRRIFLDDANMIGLPNYSSFAGRVYARYRYATLTLDAANVLGQTFSTTGYPDPAGGGTVFLFPAAGRYIKIGLTLEL
jgi:hypothetical protein